MGTVRAMVVFQGFTSLPEDRFVNTFHFFNPLEDYADHVNIIDDALDDFYNVDGAISLRSIGDRMSPAILRPFTVKYYDLTTPEPRVPTERAHLLGAAPAQSGVGMPEEVSVVLSFHGDPPVTARRRGRIYLGPFGSIGDTFSAATASSYTRVAQGFIDDILARAVALGNTAGIGWAIRSSVPAQNFVQVKGGWVDNAMDTQRRRGPDATTRSLFEVL